MVDLQPSGGRFARAMLALVLSLLPGLFGQASFAQPEVAADDRATIIVQPDAVFTYPGDTWIRSIHLAPDGEHIYAHFQVGSVNLWAVLVFHWPEIVGVLFGLMLLVMLWRLIRRKRIIGQPHCRRYNYLLINAHSDRCPECGLLLTPRNRVIGRPQSWRIALAASLLLAITGGYLAGRARLPREGAVSDWFHWLSPRLYDWAWRNGHQWLHQRKAWLTKIVEIDPSSGRITRTMFRRARGPIMGMQPTRDGDSIVIWTPKEVAQYSMETGRLLAELSLEGNPWAQQPYDYFQAMTIDPDGQTVYVALSSGSVQAWDIATGRMEEIVKLQPRRASIYVWFQYLAGQNRLAISDWWPQHDFAHRQWDPVSRSIVSEFAGKTPGGATGMLLSHDGSQLFLTHYALPLVEIRDPETGTVVDTIDAPMGDLYPAALDADGKRLFATTWARPPAVHVCDLATKRWIAELRGPVTHLQIPQVVLMPDGHTVIALGWNSTQGGISKIMVYDLDQLADKGAKAQNNKQ